MNFDYSIRVKVGIVLVILFALLSNAGLFIKEIIFYPKFRSNDEITLYEKRFKELRKMLPFSPFYYKDVIKQSEKRFEELKKILPPHGVVGYITDKEIKGVPVDNELTKRYYLAQYVLSPVIVVKTIECQLVVGDFRNAVNLEVFANRSLTLIKDFGDGIILFSSEVK